MEILAFGGLVLLVLWAAGQRGGSQQQGGGQTGGGTSGGSGGSQEPEPSQADKDRERIRDEFESDLRRKGINTPVTGDSPQEMYQSYLAGHLEYVRNQYTSDLRRRGWSGNHLPGNTTDAVYQAYMAEYDELVAQRRARSMDRIRAFYVGDLQRRGWGGQSLQGNDADTIYQNYLREYKTLLEYKYGLGSPSRAPSQPSPEPTDPQPFSGPTIRPKFSVGQKVKVGSIGVHQISSYYWSETVKLYYYRFEDRPHSEAWPEISLERAPVEGGTGSGSTTGDGTAVIPGPPATTEPGTGRSVQ